MGNLNKYQNKTGKYQNKMREYQYEYQNKMREYRNEINKYQNQMGECVNDRNVFKIFKNKCWNYIENIKVMNKLTNRSDKESKRNLQIEICEYQHYIYEYQY